MGDYIEVQLTQLVPNPDNPRDTLGDLDELATSIDTIGILQRLLVTPTADGAYMVVDGHRRYWAMRSIDYKQPIPIEVRDMDRGHRIAAAVAAGSFIRPISPIDQAKAFRALEELGYTRAQIEAATGFNQPTISTRLRLLELTPEQQQAIHDGRMSLKAAKEATYQLGRRAPDKAPRKRRAVPIVNDGTCPTCGRSSRPAPAKTEFAPRARVDHTLPPLPPVDRTTVIEAGAPNTHVVLACDDCEFTCPPSQPRQLLRHALEAHERPSTRAERTPIRLPITA